MRSEASSQMAGDLPLQDDRPMRTAPSSPSALTDMPCHPGRREDEDRRIWEAWIAAGGDAAEFDRSGLLTHDFGVLTPFVLLAQAGTGL
jgi:hypothetical protein